MIRSVLVANRGEIAVRVLRAAQELGIRAVGVYSDVDRGSLHVRLADEAIHIGAAPASQSYLSIERVMGAARAARVEALHPGYGFLSENPALAEACEAAGLVFIGPPSTAMRLLGDKVQAKRAMEQAGVPVLPGYHADDQGDATLRTAADAVGYPLLIKAAAGGGGRGMRRVDDPSQLEGALESARREALSAFGDDRVLLERLLEQARHIEVQVLCDHHGQIVHLGERECSVQRRHQKVIEEAPSPVVDETLRAELGGTAEQVMRVAGYRGAGTVEFLLGPDGRFYFMEVNARLQVEHPVTEVAWGVDLVKEQFRIASGEPLGTLPRAPSAHAIECRLYAEDPRHEYRPSTGRLAAFQPPLGPGLRHDIGVEAGDEVSSYYDPMLGKLIAWGNDRASALASARWALAHYRVAGVTTNLSQLRWVLDQPEFAARGVAIEFLDRTWEFADEDAAVPPAVFAAAAAFELGQRSDGSDPWSSGGWRLGGQRRRFSFAVDDRRADVVGWRRGDSWEIEVDGRRSDPGLLEATVTTIDDGLLVQTIGGDYLVRRSPTPRATAIPDHAARGGVNRVEAPMPGRIVRLNAAEGDHVHLNQPLVIMEAMKSEHTVAAPRDGRVQALAVQAGDQVERGALLVNLEDE